MGQTKLSYYGGYPVTKETKPLAHEAETTPYKADPKQRQTRILAKIKHQAKVRQAVKGKADPYGRRHMGKPGLENYPHGNSAKGIDGFGMQDKSDALGAGMLHTSSLNLRQYVAQMRRRKRAKDPLPTNKLEGGELHTNEHSVLYPRHLRSHNQHIGVR